MFNHEEESDILFTISRYQISISWDFDIFIFVKPGNLFNIKRLFPLKQGWLRETASRLSLEQVTSNLTFEFYTKTLKEQFLSMKLTFRTLKYPILYIRLNYLHLYL